MAQTVYWKAGIMEMEIVHHYASVYSIKAPFVAKSTSPANILNPIWSLWCHQGQESKHIPPARRWQTQTWDLHLSVVAPTNRKQFWFFREIRLNVLFSGFLGVWNSGPDKLPGQHWSWRPNYAVNGQIARSCVIHWKCSLFRSKS